MDNSENRQTTNPDSEIQEGAITRLAELPERTLVSEPFVAKVFWRNAAHRAQDGGALRNPTASFGRQPIHVVGRTYSRLS